MTYHAVFVSCAHDTEVGPKDTPEFYLAYRKAVLWELKEQGLLNEAQYACCFHELDRSEC